jgi:hypothetical protein
VATGKAKEDPLDKLANLIDAKIKEAFEDRDRSQKEASDPWARVEGIIDRAVGKHFEAFSQGLEEGAVKEKPAKGEREKKEGGGFLELLTGSGGE